MALYRCEACGCVENTASGFYYDTDDERWPPAVRGKKLCSACGPATSADGTGTGWGYWHGLFPQRSASGMHVDAYGHLWSAQAVAAGAVPVGVHIVATVA